MLQTAPTMKRVAMLGALVEGLSVPPSSESRDNASASTLTGTITNIAGGIQVVLANAGTDAFNYFWIRMLPSVHHTGAMIDRGGGCGPGPDASTVKCGVSFAGFQPGETYTVKIMTDAPYPPNGGADLFTGPGTNGPLNPAGRATGPPAPPEVPCRCLSLTAKIPAASLKLEAGVGNEKGDITIHFAV